MPLGKDDDASNDHSFIINTRQVIYSDLDSSKVPRLTFSLFLCVATHHHYPSVAGGQLQLVYRSARRRPINTRVQHKCGHP